MLAHWAVTGSLIMLSPLQYAAAGDAGRVRLENHGADAAARHWRCFSPASLTAARGGVPLALVLPLSVLPGADFAAAAMKRHRCIYPLTQAIWRCKAPLAGSATLSPRLRRRCASACSRSARRDDILLVQEVAGVRKRNDAGKPFISWRPPRLYQISRRLSQAGGVAGIIVHTDNRFFRPGAHRTQQGRATALCTCTSRGHLGQWVSMR
ncbi:hypothetical protein KCP70_02330 [Salmonella enterica subsp. enterica]|nr:hypothetical protein KCP70_02330 [Salmonella enterica subsp. enterica]